MRWPPSDSLTALVPFAPRAQRTAAVFGCEVELCLVPERAARSGGSGAEREPFRRCPAARIVREEAIWRDGALAVTPNRYPFAAGHLLLWLDRPEREPDEPFWRAACAWADQTGGSVLLNTVGAAATIARAHAHLVPARSPFLAAVPERQAARSALELPEGAELVEKQLPVAVLGVRGPVEARAAALVRLAAIRLVPAWNVVVDGGVAWILPRRQETPAPHFPYPLGSAELWGRWCYLDAAAYAAATPVALEQALIAAGLRTAG